MTPASMAAFSSVWAGSKRRMKPRDSRFPPAAASAATISSHSASVGASGFSHIVGLPAATAASAYA